MPGRAVFDQEERANVPKEDLRGPSSHRLQSDAQLVLRHKAANAKPHMNSGRAARLGRESRKQCPRHAPREFREQSNRSRHVPIGEVNEGKILGGKAPFRHDLD